MILQRSKLLFIGSSWIFGQLCSSFYSALLMGSSMRSPRRSWRLSWCFSVSKFASQPEECKIWWCCCYCYCNWRVSLWILCCFESCYSIPHQGDMGGGWGYALVLVKWLVFRLIILLLSQLFVTGLIFFDCCFLCVIRGIYSQKLFEEISS